MFGAPRRSGNLPAIHGLGCAGHGIVLMFVVPFAVMKGLSFTEAAIILSILSIVSIPSRMLTPMIAEKYGTKTIMATCLMIQGLTVICLFFSSELWHFYAFAMLFGIGFGGEWTGYLVINRQYYGNGPLGSVYGWQMSGALMGHAFVSWIAGSDSRSDGVVQCGVRAVDSGERGWRAGDD